MDWTDFLGLERSDPLFEGRLDEVGEDPEIIDFGEEFLVRFPGQGVALSAELGRVASVSLYVMGDEEDDIEPYRGELPMGLRPGMTRAQVRQVLGSPSQESERWERYALERVHCRVDFDEPGDEAPLQKVMLLHPELSH